MVDWNNNANSRTLKSWTSIKQTPENTKNK